MEKVDRESLLKKDIQLQKIIFTQIKAQGRLFEKVQGWGMADHKAWDFH